MYFLVSALFSRGPIKYTSHFGNGLIVIGKDSPNSEYSYLDISKKLVLYALVMYLPLAFTLNAAS